MEVMISMNKELDCIMPIFDCCSIVKWLACSVGDELISEAGHFTYYAESLRVPRRELVCETPVRRESNTAFRKQIA